jgi:hypothetical protein
MLPTTTKSPDRFTPEGSDVTYLIEVADSIAKARYRRAMKAVGARIWPQFAMVSSARAAIDASNPSNAAALIEVCDRFEQMTETTPDDEKRAILEAWVELSRVLQGVGGDFASRVAENEYWMELAPFIAARCFLLGSDKLPLKRGADGMIPVETLERSIESDHINPIGWRALALFAPSETEIKNSESPLPSPSGPASSPAASDPQTEAPGTSSENTTAAIQS